MTISTHLSDARGDAAGQSGPASPFAPSPFLRGLLIADAATSAGMGVLLMAGADMMMIPLGIPAVILHYAGLVLFPFAAVVLYLGTRRWVARGAIWAVVGCNLFWVLESIMLLAGGWIAPTPLGYGFVVVQAVAVAVVAELQMLALLRARKAA